MKTLAWDRTARIAEVRDRIWSYISPASRYQGSGLLLAAALLKWPEAEALRLGELQFVLSDAVGELLNSMPQLMRHLATASATDERWTTDRLHGPVQWNRTLSLRAATGSQMLFVTAPAERVYQTPENQLLVHVLQAIVDAAAASGWEYSVSRERPARILRQRLAEATRWLQNRMLQRIERVSLSQRSIARIRAGRRSHRYGAVLAAYDMLVSLVEQPDREAIRAAVEDAALVTADEATLLELLTTFRVLDALDEHGWKMQPFYLFQGRVRTHGQQGGRRIDLWYQTAPKELLACSRYREVLAAHGFTRKQDLRPDLVLQWVDRNGELRCLLIECKLSQSRGVRHAARQALADLLAYRWAFGAAPGLGHRPYGLGVAWGSGLQAADNAEIGLCTPDKISDAVGRIVI